MKTSLDLKGQRLIAKVRLNNYRYPRSGHKAGDYAIVIMNVINIIEGELSIENRDKKITIVGNMPKIEETSEYIFQGIADFDKTWGMQYQLENLRLNYNMSNEDDQRKFFSYFMTERQVEMLFSSGSNPIDMLEQKNIGKLTEIKGIGPATAARMCARYEDCKDNGRAYIALKALDLTKRMIDKLVEHYGSAELVVQKIETNPYILIREVRGIGWKKADDFAKRQGMANNCKERVMAYAQYYLEQQAEVNGNSWVTIEDLITNIKAECEPIEPETVSLWLKEDMMGSSDFNKLYEKIIKGEQIIDPYPLLYYDKTTRRAGLLRLRMIEKNISLNLKRLQDSGKEFHFDKSECEKIIKECEKEQGFEYTDEQVDAIWAILNNNVSILTGRAGSGKSSTLKPLIEIFKRYNLSVDQCALSGRASSLLSEYTGLTGKTIHRLLAYIPETGQFKYSARNQLSTDVIILDETSMVGGELFLMLIEAIKTGAKFIMLGDVCQLESIGLANILKDCITSGYIKTNILTKIHRQASMSGIISQSLIVSNGKSIVKNDFNGEEIRGELKDFKLISTFNSDLVQPMIIKEFKRLYIDRRIPAEDIQVIVPMRTRGNVSCRALNEILQNIVNPGQSKKEVYMTYVENGSKYTVKYKPNDRIIVIKNNYHAEGLDGKDKQIFNGNLGTIKDISEDVMIVNIVDVGDVILPKEQWYDIQLAYAITVHKKQGDSVPYAIVGLDTSAYTLLSRELLYTAITRAKKFCTLVTTPKAANTASRTSRVRKKQTWLVDDLSEFLIKEGAAD